MSSPRTVKQVAKETGWLSEKFLKHLAKNYSGKEFTLESLREDSVISKFMESPKKEKKVAKPRAASSSPMNFLKENPETTLKFAQENPKKPGTKSYYTYEEYKKAKTYSEFTDLGGRSDQLLWDYRKGFLQIEAGEIENFSPAEKKSNPKTKKSSSKKKEKKKKKAVVEKSVEPVAEELEEDQTPDDLDPEPEQEPDPEPEQETPVEKDDSDDSDESDDETESFNPFNITADDSDDDGNDSD